MKHWLLIIIVMVLITSCTVRKRTDERASNSVMDTTVQAAIQRILAAYYKDMSHRDWPAYRKYFWENATITTSWQQPGDTLPTVDVTTIDDFIRETPNGPDSQPVFEEHMTHARVEAKGNIAIAWADYEASFGKPDSLMHWKGTDVFTFMHHRGDWKIVSLTFEAD